MRIKSIKRIKLDEPKIFYDITVEKYHNFSIGNSRIVCHNSSLASAISKLARPFGCADSVLEGDGFFGSPVNPSPAAARYTSVKISTRYKSIIDEHKDLNVPNEEGGFDWLHVTFPIGLMTHVVGIAVGYRSNILPRKYEDVVSYLNGNKDKKLKPYFKGFKGKVSRVESLKSAWLIEGQFSCDSKLKTITIHSLSPLSRFDSFNDKLHKILINSGLDYKVENKSKDEVEVLIKIKGSDSEFTFISDRIRKETQHIVTENIVIVKDGAVLEYSSIEEYLDQFSVHKEEVLYKRILKDQYYNDMDLEFNEAKLKFLIYMTEKKRSNEEILAFLKPYPSWIQSKLEGIPLVKLSSTEIELTKNKIQEFKDQAKLLKIQVKEQNSKWQASLKNWNTLFKKNLKQSSLMMDSSSEGSYNGIPIWNAEEYLLEEEKIFSNSEEPEQNEETIEE